MASTESPKDVTDTPGEQNQALGSNDGGATATTTTTTTSTTTTTATTTTQQTKPPAQEDDESDFEDLDEVLDDFNKPKQPASTTEPVTSAASATTTTTTTTNNPAPNLPAGDFDEEAFLKQLEADMMASLMAAGGDSNSNSNDKNTAEPTGFGTKEIDELEKQLRETGIKPEDFLKGLLAETMQTPTAPKGESGSSSATAKPGATTQEKSGSFQDTIQRTLERMQESGDRATAATNEDSDIPGDLLEQLLKAVEAGAAGGGGDGENMDLNKMFMGMMEQLSNKEMLYEPMKELHTKFGPWLEANKTKVSAEEFERFETQARLVGEIVSKFDEDDFSDDKPECRAYIWERMQAMQAAGSPPDDLIANPLLDEVAAGDGGNGPGMPDCPQQ